MYHHHFVIKRSTAQQGEGDRMATSQVIFFSMMVVADIKLFLSLLQVFWSGWFLVMYEQETHEQEIMKKAKTFYTLLIIRRLADVKISEIEILLGFLGIDP